MTRAEQIIAFNKGLHFNKKLPAGIRIMNPYRENEYALEVSSAFYRKFYNDNRRRHIILGINPGRFGSGVTGVSFTDTKRLRLCGIDYPGKETHEPSSVFIYEMIAAYGGPAAFYKDFYINSICPLGFTRITDKGREINYNYYDRPDLYALMEPFIIGNIRKQLNFGIYHDTGYCFGTGKNYRILEKLNAQHHFFSKLIPLEHPRFIMQYKAKFKEQYIKKYLEAFGK